MWIAPDLAQMVRPHSAWPEGSRRYGLGFHLHATDDAVWPMVTLLDHRIGP